MSEVPNKVLRKDLERRVRKIPDAKLAAMLDIVEHESGGFWIVVGDKYLALSPYVDVRDLIVAAYRIFTTINPDDPVRVANAMLDTMMREPIVNNAIRYNKSEQNDGLGKATKPQLEIIDEVSETTPTIPGGSENVDRQSPNLRLIHADASREDTDDNQMGAEEEGDTVDPGDSPDRTIRVVDKRTHRGE